MSIIQAYEVFYSRVETAYSPRRRSGYQVVYSSPALDSNIVREVENIQRCFEAQSVSQRYQYFHLSDGSIALCASQMLDTISTTITDQAGRPGVFISHCLVLDPSDFAALGNNPFAVIDAGEVFILDAESMIAVQKQQTAVRELEFEDLDETNTDYYSFSIEGWKEDDFAILWQAAANARTLGAQQQGFAIQSDDTESALALLRLFMTHLPPDLRFYCTFNSFVDGCEPLGGQYWAVAGTRKPRLGAAVRVRLDRQSVEPISTPFNAGIDVLARQVYAELCSAQGIEDDQNT